MVSAEWRVRKIGRVEDWEGYVEMRYLPRNISGGNGLTFALVFGHLQRLLDGVREA